MADIFISYAREDEPRVKDLVHALEGHGRSVFWDRRIPAGQSWESYIEQNLSDAKCVVVVWSHQSVESKWVKIEATDAEERGVMVPVLLDHVKPPLAFRHIQTADLTDWKPGLSSPRFDQLLQDIAGVLEPRSAHEPPSSKPEPSGTRPQDPEPGPDIPKPPIKRLAVKIIVLIALAVVIAVGAKLISVPEPKRSSSEIPASDVKPEQPEKAAAPAVGKKKREEPTPPSETPIPPGDQERTRLEKQKQASAPSYGQEVGRDGAYVAYANGIVKDTKTGLEWVAEPGKGTNWNEAKAWVQSLQVGGGGWRMPTVKELEGLYEKGKGRSNMTHLLMTVMTNSPWIVWSGETSDSSAAWGFDFLTGGAYWTSFVNQSFRAFAVRSRGGG